MKNCRLSLAALWTVVGLTLLLPASPVRAALALDTGFGTGGIRVLDIGPGADVVRDIGVQLDGQLVVTGRSPQVVGGDILDLVVLARVNGTTGATDPNFGTAGTVTFLPGLSATAGGGGDGRALAIQPLDQKILVAGTWRATQAGNSQVFVARFGTTGVLDATFGVNGVVLFTPAGVTNPETNALGLRSDGSIILAGSGTGARGSLGFITGLTSTGGPIPGFSDALVENPLVNGDNFGFNSVVVLPGDGILAAGGGGDLTLVQLTANGVLDGSFAGDGIGTFNFLTFDTVSQANTPSFDVATALTVLVDGRILVSGRAGISALATSTNRVLARVLSNGTLDSTFGSGGFAPLADVAVQEVPEGLGVRSSGDLVLVGLGFTPTQISGNGIAVSPIAGAFSPVLSSLTVLTDGSVAATGSGGVGGSNTGIAIVRLAATDLPDGADTVPAPFAFITQSGLEPGRIITSNTVTITGINAPAPISISAGDAYSVGCAIFTGTPGTITNGQTLCLKTDASQSDLAAKSAFITVGGVLGQFTLITGDSTPAPFTFVPQTGVVAGAQITSAPVTLSGFTTATDLAVTGGTYSLGCTATYVSGFASVNPGVQVCVRHTAATAPGGVVNTTLQAGINTLVEGTFSSTTEGDITPNPFSFAPQTGVAKATLITSASVTLTGFSSNSPVTVTGGAYSLGCTDSFTTAAGVVAPDTQVCVRQTSSAIGGTATSTRLTVGTGAGVTGLSANFTVTTEGAPDTIPEPFSFTNQTGVALGTVLTSNVITLGGYDSNTLVTITGGSYSVGCGIFFATTTGTLAPNAQVCVRQTSALTGDTDTLTVLTVGGVGSTFKSTTLVGDSVPALFSFPDQTGVNLFTPITSAPATITSIDVASPISVVGGEYSIGCTSTFTAIAATVTNGQTVCLRQTSSFNSNTNVVTRLTVATVSATFTTTTKTGDQIPDDFSFTSQDNLALNTLATSNTIRVTGVDSPVAVFADGPRTPSGSPLFGFSIGCNGLFDGLNGTVIEPDTTLCVGLLSASTNVSPAVLTLTVGGTGAANQKRSTFTVTTGETRPAPFTFTDQVGVLLSSTVYADRIIITGITAPSRVQISANGQYQIDCTGGYTGSDGLVTNGQALCVRQATVGALSSLTNTVLSVGGVSDTFTTTTVADKPLPGSSGMDAWTLLVLVPLLGYRRRRSAVTPRR